MSRTVIVRRDSRVIDDPRTRILFRYANGDVLVDTDAPATETSHGAPPSEEAVSTGVVIPEATQDSLDAARASLDRIANAAQALAYVELRGPADAGMLEALRATGIQPLLAVPTNTYLASGSGKALRAARALPFVLAVTPVSGDLKGQATTSEADSEFTDVTIVGAASLVDPTSFAHEIDSMDGVRRVGQPEVVASLVRIPARVNHSGQARLLSDPRVLRVESRQPPRAEDEVADLILVGSYDGSGTPQGSFVTWLDDHAINGGGVTIGIVDQGVDVTHPAFAGRITDLNGGAKDWHGTFVAGHAAGAYMDHRDSNGFVYGVGMAPNASLISQDNKKSATTLCSETVTGAGSTATSFVQNNSWGAGTHDPMDYQSQEAAYDALVRNATPSDSVPRPLTICFSAGNDGTAGLTRPKAAKNLIVTGNSESYRPDVGGTEADNIREVYTGAHPSSHGNCGDGRIRPHVVAPGEWTAAANYDSHPGEKEYIDSMLTWGGGSSGASPKTAGACALLAHWWRNHDGGAVPSPAMLRALLVNGAEPIDSGGPIPNNVQGWGRLNLRNVVDDTLHHTFVDQSVLLASRGDARAWTIRPSDPSRPVYITLAWTDPPGAPGSGTSTAPAVVNKLALRVRTKSALYRANQFASGWSVPDRGTPKEGWDNTQCVFLRPQDLGDTLEVSVTALELAMDCLTNAADTPRQDFALVIRNGFVDRGATPADVFLVIDAGAASPPLDGGSSDHWAPGSSDHGEVSGPPLGNGSTGTGSSSTPDASPGGAPDDDADAWWNESGTSATETHKAPPPVPAAVGAGAQAGLSLASDALSTVAGNPAELTSPVAKLSTALGRIDASWATHDASRRRAAVVVVGDATLVSNADIAALRRLSFRGELWILSTTGSILSFLAQRVHRRTGIHFRLCANAATLAREVRDSLAEAAGLQQLVVSTVVGESFPPIIDASFEVVPEDVALIIRIQGSGAPPTSLSLRRPNRPELVLDPNKPPKDLDVRVSRDAIELRLSLAEGAQHGTWSVHFRGSRVGPVPAVDVYARSRLHVGGTTRPTRSDPFLALHGSVRFSELHLGPPRVAGKTKTDKSDKTDKTDKQGEDRRGIDVTLTTSRIDAGGKAGEVPKAALGPTIGTLVRAPSVSQGARVIHLVGSVHGASGQGSAAHTFGRVVRTGIVELEPRSRWRARLTPLRPIVTDAIVEDVIRGAEGIVAVVLGRGGSRRPVTVESPLLRKALEEIDLRAANLKFQVRGSQLLGVLRPLGPGLVPIVASGDGSAGGGLVALAGLEPPTHAAEDTVSADYSGASRYVQAKYFQARPGGRTISRVVIHITDGGSNINGTIAWFQDPRQRDGSPLPVSAHYVVGQDGEVVQMVREQDVAYHANSANGDSIGIEHCARSKGALGANDPGLLPTSTQYAASAALVRDICARFGLPLDRAHVLGHNEADTTTTHRGCPTNVWDWTYYLNQLLQAAPSGGDGGSSSDAGASGPVDGGGSTGGSDDAGTGPTDGGAPVGGTGVGDGGMDDTDVETETEKAAIVRATALMQLGVARPASTYVQARPMVRYLDGGNQDDGRLHVALRPRWVGGRVPYLPTIPAPTLGDPIPAGEFVLWPDPPRSRVFFALAQPKLRRVAVVVNRANVVLDGGGTTTKITGGSATLTVGAYVDAEATTVPALEATWRAELANRGVGVGPTWQFEPVGLHGLDGTLTPAASDVMGPVTSVAAVDAGTLTFTVPLSEAGALNWYDRFQSGTGSSLVGTCALTAAYVAQLGTTLDTQMRTLACDLGSLLAAAGAKDVTVVDPQVTVVTRIIVTAHELVDAVTVDAVPSEGAAPVSLAFTKEGGQTTIPVTSQHMSGVTVPYTATVRYTPPGWPVVQQTGVLRFAEANWDLWVKPDSWIIDYNVCAMLLDAQNRIIEPGGAAGAEDNTVTVRIDYRHPGLPETLSLTFQVTGQELVKVPFPNPPGSAAPATVSITVLGARAGTPAGPKTRALAVDETMIVIKSYINGAIDIRTNKDTTPEDSIESNTLGVLARLT